MATANPEVYIPRALQQLPIYHPGRGIFGSVRELLRDPLAFQLEGYRRYGSVYRVRFLQRTHLVMAGQDANTFVWRNTDLWNYPERMKIFREGYDHTAVLQLQGPEHHQKHHRMSRGHAQAAILPMMGRLEGVLAKELAAVRDTTVNLQTLCKRLATSVTFYAVLQSELPAELDIQIDRFSHHVLTGDAFNFVVGYGRLGRLLGPVRRLWYRQPAYRRLRQEILDVINTILDRRAAHPPTEDDTLAHMLRTLPAGETISRPELALDILFLFPAGTEPTAHLLLWALLYVYQSPTWLAELRHELQAWDPAAVASMNQWPKLKATILETERIRPLLPFALLVPQRSFVFQGIQVHATTPVFHTPAVTHFLPEIYEDPLAFKPQRFLTDMAYPPAGAHSTYGGGDHTCIGKNLARLETMLGLAHIVRHYDLVFEQTPTFRPMMEVVLAPADPIAARLVPRTDAD